MATYNDILCVVDQSEENRILAQRAAELAELFGARLGLLHVVEHLPAEVTNNIVLPDHENIEDHLVTAAKRDLDELKSSLATADVSVDVVLGSPRVSIVETAKEKNIDLIIIGRHGRHGISRLLGSTANAVLHHAPCDVLAVNLGE